ncbi:MAG: tripartite tricarboxylate transporter substrate binding protein [Alphaproteobacteria bacterium]|nr:tripartite tricarboxylate transporter substrate binding protein [Alphaproteobacteria bacterium]
MPARILCCLFAIAALLAGPATHVSAQSFPAKSVRLVVPYAPGGGTDNLVRILAPVITANSGQQIIIDNRPGAGGTIGTDIVARSAPDGYTILAADSAFVVNPGLLRNMPYDTLKTFRGVTMLAQAPVILVAHPSVPVKTLGEFVSLAKSKPGMLTYASGGNGSAPHLAGELLKLAAGIDVLHVPYKGTAPAMNDLLAGQVSVQFSGISSSKQHIDAGKLNALAVTGARRNPAVASVPTFIESGIAGIDADSYWGIYAPTGTPDSVIAALNDHFVRAMRAPQLADRLTQLGFEPIANSPAEHDRQMRAMIASWTDLIKRANITAD